ncbi:MAG: hypothetical protein WD607_05175 [Candidatus Paceibacterota bacterium]
MSTKKSKPLLMWLVEGEFALTLPRLITAIGFYIALTFIFKFGEWIAGGPTYGRIELELFKIGIGYIVACQVCSPPESSTVDEKSGWPD